jgi:nucleotide-binding universal stress UspA family protein
MDILVCLEGSPSSARAIEVAFEVAHAVRATLVGLAIIDAPDIVAGAATSIGGASYRKDRDDALLADAHARASEWLDGFVERGRAAGIAVKTLELEGRPAETIVQELQNHDAMIVGRDVNFRFETQERDRYTRDRILRRAGKPIIVVPAQPVTAGSAVLIAYDGSAAAVRALRSFAASGLARGRDVYVATVNDDGANAFEIASQGCGLLHDEYGIAARPDNIVSIESTADALLARRDKLGAGLLVVGGYVPSPLARLVWGSVTHAILENTAVPVFVHY